MDGLSGVPTYSEDSQKEKLEKGLMHAWPKVYRFFNGIFYFTITTIKNTVIGAIQQVFRW